MQEKAVEVSVLRERVSNAEERAEAHQRELERLHERLSETEREANRLSRSLSAERFEKERVLAEWRLASTSSAGTTLFHRPPTALHQHHNPLASST